MGRGKFFTEQDPNQQKDRKQDGGKETDFQLILKSAGDDTDERGTRRTAEITGKSKECKHGGAAARTCAGSETEGAGPENTDRKAAEPAAGKSENRRRGERGGEVAQDEENAAASHYGGQIDFVAEFGVKSPGNSHHDGEEARPGEISGRF